MRTRASSLLPILLATLPFAGAPARGEEPTPAAPGLSLVVSSEGLAFAPGKVAVAGDGTPEFEVLADQRRQTVAGFGGAFNEKGWEALGRLSAAERAEALDRIFAPGEGLGLAFGRIPIGASDYALSRYALDETLSQKRHRSQPSLLQFPHRFITSATFNPREKIQTTPADRFLPRPRAVFPS